jgi:hypothetical protein
MEFPLTLWPNLLPPLLFSQMLLLDDLFNYGTCTMLKEWSLLSS